MPNWTENNLTIKSKTKRHLDTLINRVKSEENEFDFDKIVPMPKNIFRGNLGSKEREKYNENNWYDWSIKNWGTKWNSVDVHVERISDTEVEYFFLTAWCPPMEIYLALLNNFNKFGNHEFEWICLDEDDREFPYNLNEHIEVA